MSIDYLYLVRKIIGSMSTMRFINTIMGRGQDNTFNRLLATEEEIKKALLRLTTNREIIGAVCKEQGIICVFVDHPTPTVHYDNSKRPVSLLETDQVLLNSDAVFSAGVNSTYGYKLLAEHYNTQPSRNHIDLSKVSSQEPVYIDRFHFSKQMNKEIALHISNHLKLLGF